MPDIGRMNMSMNNITIDLNDSIIFKDSPLKAELGRGMPKRQKREEKEV
jgi:hypothetical protein